MNAEEYYELRAKMDVRLKKAWARLCKENGWKDDSCQPDTQSSETANTHENSHDIGRMKPQMPNSFVVYLSLCILGCMGLMILSN